MKNISHIVANLALACSLSVWNFLGAQDLFPDENFQMGVDNCCYDEYEDDWSLWNSGDYFFLEYVGGDGISYKNGYGAAGIFLSPFSQRNTNLQPFFDGQFYYFGGKNCGGSVGLGLRYQPDGWNKVVGINAYYDNRRDHGHVFNQVGVGVELLGADWDIRVNGYIPVGDFNHKHETLFDLSYDFFAVNRPRVTAWYGVDAEFGSWLFKRTSCSPINLYAAIGPYYYFREHERHWREGKHNAFGGRLRLSALLSDYVDVSFVATYDPVWHTRLQGQIALIIPFNILKKCRGGCQESCSCKPTLCQQIISQPVERNGIIVIDSECRWKWNWSGACESSSDRSRSRSSSHRSSSGRCPKGRSFHSSDFSSSFFSRSSCSHCSD